MKKQIWKATALFAGLGLLASCSSEETQVTPENKTAEVSFSVNIGDITRTEIVDKDNGGTDACVDPEDFRDELSANEDSYYAEITLNTSADPIKKKLRIINDKIVSDPISLVVAADGTHQVMSFLIKKPKSGTETTDKIYWSSVAEDPTAKFYTFVPDGHRTPMPIKWTASDEDQKFSGVEKKVCDITLLCAVNDYATNFGYAQWGADLVKATCINYSVNVCGGCNAEDDGHEIGTSTVRILKDGKELWTNEDNPSKPGTLGEMCFGDNLSKEDADEIFTIILDVKGFTPIQAVVKGSDIFEGAYEESGYWEKPIAPNCTAVTGYLHFDLCDQIWKAQADVEPLDPTADHLWNFKVTNDLICDADCPSQCGSSIFTEFGKMECGKCEWKVPCGTSAYEDGYKFIALGQEFISPEYSFKHEKQYQIVFHTYGKKENGHSFIKLNDPFRIENITASPEADPNTYKWRTYTVTFELKDNRENCEILKVKFKPGVRNPFNWCIVSPWYCIYDTWFQSIEEVE